MKKLLPIIAILFLTVHFANGQKLKDPDSFLVPNIDSLPKFFLIGTFHFEYYNLDAYKVEKTKQVDILSEQKQREIKRTASVYFDF